MTEPEAAPVKLEFKLPSRCPQVKLTPQQKQYIASNLPPLQNIIHYIFWSQARYNGKEGYTLLTVLTGNMITIFQDKNFNIRTIDEKANKSNNKQDYDCELKLFKNCPIYLNELVKIAYDSKEKSSLINAEKKKKKEKRKTSESESIQVTKDKKEKKDIINIQYLKDDDEYNLVFLQCVYRNYSINFSVLKDSNNFVKAYSDKIKEYFPVLQIHISPSQKFQFYYYAQCVKSGTEYSQQVVQYIHSLVLLGMPIVDISKLPLISNKDQNFLKPVFRALSNQEFVCGICCENKRQPELMKNIRFVLHQSSKISLLHFNNCKMHKGLRRLNSYIDKKEGSNIKYWNLRKNHFKDIKFFIKILKNTKPGLLFLDLSECHLTDVFMIDLFRELANFPTLQQLHIAKSANSKAVVDEFDKLLTSYESSGPINLRSLDLSQIEDIDSYFIVLNKHDVPLRSLKIAGVNLDGNSSNELEKFIKNSTTLRSLDLTNLICEDPIKYLAKILRALNENNKLKHFDLCMDSLKLNKGSWSTIFSAFLSGNDLETKWNSISLNSNNMTGYDIKNITPLLAMMNIRSLSINDNFTSEMKGIGNILKDMINQCSTLEKLHIAGSKTNKLSSEINEVVDILKDTAISEIDFSNNNAGEEFYNKLKKSISDKNKDDDSVVPFTSISIDGNGLPSVSILTEITNLIKDKYVVKFEFPDKDCKELLKKPDNNKDEYIDSISKAKVNLVRTINFNRAKQNMMPDLPFKTTREMNSLIKQLTKEMREKICNEDALKHTLFCEELGLPLPYQEMKETVKSSEIQADPSLDGKNEIYHSDYLTKYVDEKPDIETDFNFKSDSESYYSDEDQEQKLEEEEEIADSSRKKITFDLNNKDENDEESKKDENEDENKKDENNEKSKEEDNEENNENKNNEKNKEEEDNDDNEKDNKKKKKKNEEEDEEDERRRRKHRKSRKDEEEDEEDEEDDRRRRKRKHRKSRKDEEEDEEDYRKRNKRKHRRSGKYEDEDDEDEDDYRKRNKRKHRRSGRYEDEEDEEDDRGRNRRRHRSSRKYEDEEDEEDDRGRNRRRHRSSRKYEDEEDEEDDRGRNRRRQRSSRKYEDEEDEEDDRGRNRRRQRSSRNNNEEEELNDQNIKRRSHRQNQQHDSEDERPPSAAKNKIENTEEDEDDDENEPIRLDDDKVSYEQEKKADEEMDNFILNSSQNLGAFRIKINKTQKAPGKRRPPPPNLSISQRRQKTDT